MLKLTRPGLVMIVAGLQILLLVQVSEYLYPGYSVSSNYISDLGVGPWPSWGFFSFAVSVFGLLMLLVALSLRGDRYSWLWVPMAISGVGAIGVGLFNENTGAPHVLFAFLAFAAGNVAALYSFKVTRRPLAFVCLLLGMLGLAALVLVGIGADLGLGMGGMERMTYYTGVFWVLMFGAHDLATQDLDPGQG